MDSGGRHGAPLGRLDSTRTPGLHNWLARGVLSCARGCRLLYLLSAEGDNNQFPYKDDAHGCPCSELVLDSSWTPARTFGRAGKR